MIKDYSKLIDRIYVQLSPELSQEFHNMLTDMATELSRLYEIENAKPSEALEDLEQLVEMADKCWVSCDVHKWKSTIKQYILKAQEQEKENDELKSRIHSLEIDLEVQRNLVIHLLENENKALSLEILKAEEKQKEKEKLDRVDELMQLPFKIRRQMGEEYIEWCEKNNAKYNDATTMITWVLCFKLKEVLNKEYE